MPKTRLILNKLYELGIESTTHGIPKIVKTFREDEKSLVTRYILRVVWTICFIASFTLCCYMIVMTLGTYFDYGANTQISIKYFDKDFPFPGILICNYNPFATPDGNRYMVEYFQRKYNDPNIRTLFDVMAKYVKNAHELYDDFDTLRTQLLYPNMSQSRQKFGYDFNSTFIECLFNSKDCEQENFISYYDASLGNCKQFNFISPYLTIDRVGSRYGLRMVLFLGLTNMVDMSYLSFTMPYIGVRLSIFNQTYMPSLSSYIDLKPGTCTSIQLKSVHVRHLSSPFNDCVELKGYKSSTIVSEMYATNTSYMQEICQQLYDQKLVIQACKCYDPNQANIYSVEPCLNTSQSACLEVVSSSLARGLVPDSAPDKYTECPSECERRYYEFSQSIVDFPSHAYAQKLVMNPVMIKNFADWGEKLMPYDRLKESLVCVNIYFSKLEETLIDESPSYTILDALSNIGGMLGLLLGGSVLSLVELVDVVVEICYVKFGKPRNKVLVNY